MYPVRARRTPSETQPSACQAGDAGVLEGELALEELDEEDVGVKEVEIDMGTVDIDEDKVVVGVDGGGAVEVMDALVGGVEELMDEEEKGGTDVVLEELLGCGL